MPKVKDILPSAYKLAKDLEKTEGIQEIYIWGSCAANANKPNYRIKDLDILIKTSFHAEDLISIDYNATQQDKNDEKLQEEGFDPKSVKFSKKIASLKNPLTDFWALSGDHKLIHWGAIFTDKLDSDNLKKDAETFAENKSGVSLRKINKAPEIKRKHWYALFHDYYLNQISGMPSGWYQSEQKDAKNILEKCIKID